MVKVMQPDNVPDSNSETVLTFLLKTHLPDLHPGVVNIQGRVGSSTHEIGGYIGIFLYHGRPGEGALTIAKAIYQEETHLRQSSKVRDPRFDFLSPCTISFSQIKGSETIRSWK